MPTTFVSSKDKMVILERLARVAIKNKASLEAAQALMDVDTDYDAYSPDTQEIIDVLDEYIAFGV